MGKCGRFIGMPKSKTLEYYDMYWNGVTKETSQVGPLVVKKDRFKTVSQLFQPTIISLQDISI